MVKIVVVIVVVVAVSMGWLARNDTPIPSPIVVVLRERLLRVKRSCIERLARRWQGIVQRDGDADDHWIGVVAVIVAIEAFVERWMVVLAVTVVVHFFAVVVDQCDERVVEEESLVPDAKKWSAWVDEELAMVVLVELIRILIFVVVVVRVSICLLVLDHDDHYHCQK